MCHVALRRQALFFRLMLKYLRGYCFLARHPSRNFREFIDYLPRNIFDLVAEISPRGGGESLRAASVRDAT